MIHKEDKTVQKYSIARGFPSQGFAVVAYSQYGVEVEMPGCGYMSILHYTLMHTNTSIPKPIVDDTKQIKELRMVLNEWVQGRYPESPNKMLCFLGDFDSPIMKLEDSADATAEFRTVIRLAKDFGIDVRLVDIHWTIEGTWESRIMTRDEYTCRDWEIEEPDDGFEYSLNDEGLELRNFRVFDETRNEFREVSLGNHPSFNLGCVAFWDPEALLEILEEDPEEIPKSAEDEEWTGYSVSF